MSGILLPIGFLFIAVIDDLIYKKFHNFLFLSLSLVGFIFLATWQRDFFITGFLGFFTGALLMSPLVVMRALGAGDLKFMMCLGILMGPLAITEIFVNSIFWGAILGVLSILSPKSLPQFKKSIIEMTHLLTPSHTHKIPYTVAIALGWLTHSQWSWL